METGLAVSTQGMHPRNLPHVHTRLVHECSQQPKIRDVPKAGEKEPVTKGHTQMSRTEISGCQGLGWAWKGLLLGRVAEAFWNQNGDSCTTL